MKERESKEMKKSMEREKVTLSERTRKTVNLMKKRGGRKIEF